jgi:general secretion pathway protein K
MTIVGPSLPASDSAAPRSSKRSRGAALLAVLWLTAALTAIAFTLANTVRGEIERSSTDADGLKAYYLAAGAIDRTLVYIESGPAFPGPDGKPLVQVDITRRLFLKYPTGVAQVEYIPENSKLNVNVAPPDELNRLLVALGVDPMRAPNITAAILDWRGGTPGGSFSQFDQYYLSLTPSFRARHASVQEIEELLLVRGITPDLFYGGYTRGADGRLIPHDGLRDCLSVYGSTGVLDINSVAPEVMVALGVPPATASAIIAMRNTTPIQNVAQIAAFSGGGPAMGRLGLNGGPVVTLRATAQLRLPNGQLSDMRRTVSAMVKILSPQWNPPYHIMRWYDNASVLR